MVGKVVIRTKTSAIEMNASESQKYVKRSVDSFVTLKIDGRSMGDPCALGLFDLFGLFGDVGGNRDRPITIPFGLGFRGQISSQNVWQFGGLAVWQFGG
jgi:hypothetical protein